MPTGPIRTMLQHVRGLMLAREAGDQTDAQLLEDFLANRAPAAFEALVRRHGPMVLGVCRRVLQDAHEAEDAFQATFLVLVRKAEAVRPRELVGHWLYGVAYRTALKAKGGMIRRRTRERQAREMPQTHDEQTGHDLLPLLDEELHRLPDQYRVPIVLCALEGRSRAEAARQLGVPEGTLSSRLARARELLAQRLGRRGVLVPAGTLAAVLSPNVASASVPAPLLLATVQAAMLSAAEAAAAGVLSAKVAALTEGVLRAMFYSKLKVAVAVLFTVGLLATGAGWWPHDALAEKPASLSEPIDPAEEKPAVKENTRPMAVNADALDVNHRVLTTLAKARLEAANKAYAAMSKQYGTGTRDIDQLYQWSLRCLAAEREASENKADRVTALEAHMKRMEELKKEVNKGKTPPHRATGGYTLSSNFLTKDDADLAAVEFYRAEALLWLAQAQSK